MAVTNTSTSSAQLRWNDVTDAIKQGKSWLDFFPNKEIVKKTDTEMCLRMGRYEISITILAFGNFNHDGFDDMLVFYDQSVMDGQTPIDPAAADRCGPLTFQRGGSLREVQWCNIRVILRSCFCWCLW